MMLIALLQSVAVCCSMLQCVASLECVADRCVIVVYDFFESCSTLQCVVWCSVLQCVAVHCSMLQCVAPMKRGVHHEMSHAT